MINAASSERQAARQMVRERHDALWQSVAHVAVGHVPTVVHHTYPGPLLNRSPPASIDSWPASARLPPEQLCPQREVARMGMLLGTDQSQMSHR